MSEAIEALEKVTGVRAPEDKGIEPTSLAQLSRAARLRKGADPALSSVVNLLRKAGSTKQTAALSKLADKIAALNKQTPGSGTFDQIKNMIQKMIFHLAAEQKDEDDHKNWCDKELETTAMMKKDEDDHKNWCDKELET